MRRAVITGIGVISSIGNNKEEVLASLKAGKSGITYSEQFEQYNLRSRVWGNIKLDPSELIDRKVMRFMGDAAAYAYLSMQQAIEDAGLPEDQVSNERTGIVTGSGGASGKNTSESADIAREKGVKRVGPYMVPRTMSSTTSACLATPFKIKGVNYTISSACATSAHCIGHALELIQLGKQDIIFAGGGEELDWSSTIQFDAMGALSTKYNDNPEKASRTYDADRDGFVISGGGGILVVEELEHALARGAHIYAEITGQFPPHYMAETDFAFDLERKPEILHTLMVERRLPVFSEPVVGTSYADGCKVYFEEGWIIARFSGTEPLLRIFCELPSRERAEKCCDEFREFLRL